MSSRVRAPWRALLLLGALLCSTAVPRVFVVCVSADDHVSLEAVFEGDPCETNFIFGARAETGWPAAACTDIPVIQLTTLTDAASSVIDPPATPTGPLPLFASLQREQTGPVSDTDWRDVPPPPRLERRALRTIVLRL